jgi:hypothetical protein
MYIGGPGRSTNPPVLLSLPWLPRLRGMGIVIDVVADLVTAPEGVAVDVDVEAVVDDVAALSDAAAATDEDMERVGPLVLFDDGDVERARAADETLDAAPGDADVCVVAARMDEKILKRLNAGRSA